MNDANKKTNKLVLNTETLKSLNVQTGVKAGLLKATNLTCGCERSYNVFVCG